MKRAWKQWKGWNDQPEGLFIEWERSYSDSKELQFEKVRQDTFCEPMFGAFVGHEGPVYEKPVQMISN